MTQTDTTPQSQVLQAGALLTLKAGVWTRGEAGLTGDRFYRKVRGSGFLYSFFGLLGALINSALPEKTDIDIPLNTISEIGRGKMGMKKDVLYIGTIDGKSYQLTPNYAYWIAGLKGALESQGAVLAQTGDERWTIQR